MSDDSDELSIANDNFVVASKVMSSAIRILALLDLSDRQIANLFEAEAGEGKAHDHSLPAVDDDDVTDARPWRLGRLAENEDFSKEIDRFAKRVSALRTDQEPGPRALDVAANYALVLERLDRLAPGSETPRSELVNAIVRDLPMKIDSWLIESWLAVAANGGQIELYKKSNRWQVRRPAL